MKKKKTCEKQSMNSTYMSHDRVKVHLTAEATTFCHVLKKINQILWFLKVVYQILDPSSEDQREKDESQFPRKNI